MCSLGLLGPAAVPEVDFPPKGARAREPDPPPDLSGTRHPKPRQKPKNVPAPTTMTGRFCFVLAVGTNKVK